MSEEAPTTDAARRAAARKAKILARGNTGLQKLAQTARGDEAEKLYGHAHGQDSSASSTPRSPPSPAPQGPIWGSTPSSSSLPGGGPSPEELRAAQEQFFSAFGGGGLGGGGGIGPGSEGIPDISQLFAQMMGGMQPPGSGGPNLLGDLDDPAGLGLGLGGAPFPFPGMPGLGPPKEKSKIQRFWPLIHLLSVLALVAFTVVWWEPALHAASNGGWKIASGRWVNRWAGLQGSTGLWGKVRGLAAGDLAPMPLFWAFTTIQLLLQTTRFFVLRSPPPPHSLIQNFLPLLPPKLARPLVTGSRYLTMLSQFWKDGCMLVFALGMVVVGSGLFSDRVSNI
ncbi:hypothetical protein BCR39DRAFT_544442 [Naematelia encephala]|uniref:GET complex, subunit GET2 n=1 Tax=Naematelia encephala TaxID=71784 RepID=A0A1Y2AS18_9TREE|nr:hypothetical protein BCR39DRAFT_544442 [Naematelia encephala]